MQWSGEQLDSLSKQHYVHMVVGSREPRCCRTDEKNKGQSGRNTEDVARILVYDWKVSDFSMMFSVSGGIGQQHVFDLTCNVCVCVCGGGHTWGQWPVATTF